MKPTDQESVCPNQVIVRILEVRQLSGNNLFPFVEIVLGDQVRTTKAKQSTNDAYFDEDFVINLNSVSKQAFLQQILILNVYSESGIFRANKLIGCFKIDLATIDAQTNHGFFRKWALLLNPESPLCGVRGYLKCDLLIPTPGVTAPPPLTDENDIESNLLIPEGMSDSLAERQPAKFVVSIFHAQHLPVLTKGVMTTVKKAFVGEAVNLFGSYVQVAFAGRKGKTDVIRHDGDPIWNQEIIFIELFPALVKMIRLHIKDESGSLIATGLLDLSLMSDTSQSDGYLPTFGPAYVNLYGDFRENITITPEISATVGSVAYRGRVCVSVNVELLEFLPKKQLHGVAVRDCTPCSKISMGKIETYSVAASIFDTTMIESRFCDKQLHFELSMGIYGLDESATQLDEEQRVSEECLCKRTQSISAKRLDANFCHLDINADKPCMRIDGRFQIHTFRYRDSFELSNCALKWDQIIVDVRNHIENDHLDLAADCLRRGFAAIGLECKRCAEHLTSCKNLSYGKTKLDIEKRQQRRRFLKSSAVICSKAEKSLKSRPDELRLYFFTFCSMRKQLEHLSIETQESLPDVFLYICFGEKRIGYKRFSASELLNINCGSQTDSPASMTCFFMKKPARKGRPSRNVALINGHFSIQLADQLNFFGLPGGFSLSSHEQDKRMQILRYNEVHQYQLRCYLFQGRSLIGMDDSGLSDPFVRVIFKESILESETVTQTLCPIWDQMLISPAIKLYGSIDYYHSNPPIIHVQVLDRDKDQTEFMGQTEVRPVVCTVKSRLTPSPCLTWWPLQAQSEPAGDIMAAFELRQIDCDADVVPDDPSNAPGQKAVVSKLPPYIRPETTDHIMNVYFWGVRGLKSSGIFAVEEVIVNVECSGQVIHSEPVLYKKHGNFNIPYKSTKISLPLEQTYWPSITIRCIDRKAFGRSALVGSCTISNIQRFFKVHDQKAVEIAPFTPVDDEDDEVDEIPPTVSIESATVSSTFSKTISEKCSIRSRRKSKEKQSSTTDHHDWWTKYYATVIPKQMKDANVPKLMIYESELEKVIEFGGFRDCFDTFDLTMGKASFGSHDDTDNLRGSFKGTIGLTACSDSFNLANNNQSETVCPSEPIKVLVRLYVIKATNLRPCDANGKADPYLYITTGKTTINDKENRINCQLNPVFGRAFEFEATFPYEHELLIRLYDWDQFSADDFMGETKIDLEQRFYSKYRPKCGLQSQYVTHGFNQWRDVVRPTQILSQLCRTSKLPRPIYSGGQVSIGTSKFGLSDRKTTAAIDRENLALNALLNWNTMPNGYKLVPEHLETRTLYLPEEPGVEQGKLQLWLDLFPVDGPPPPPPVDISPRKPKQYQLRVTLWDTKNVTLDDYNIINGLSTVDQYIKSFLIDPKIDLQQTDIHYRSLNGEGNFNWRFIFNFEYLEAEEKIVYRSKSSAFSSEIERKSLPIVNFQLWDADVITPDDYLGSASFNLTRIRIGAKSAKRCGPKLTRESKKSRKYLNLFTAKRTRGWWPFVKISNKVGNKATKITGKADLEFHLLPTDEAERRPVGVGRDPPEPLEPPHRPETSFAWFASPWKMLKYDVWIGMRWRCLALLAILLFLLFFACFLYQLPQSFAKKLVLG